MKFLIACLLFSVSASALPQSGRELESAMKDAVKSIICLPMVPNPAEPANRAVWQRQATEVALEMGMKYVKEIATSSGQLLDKNDIQRLRLVGLETARLTFSEDYDWEREVGRCRSRSY